MSLAASVSAEEMQTIHGITVHDPFWWLENRDSDATEAWIRTQQVCYEEFFADAAELPYIREQVRRHIDVETIDQPFRVGEKLFYRRRRPGQEQPAICVRWSRDAEEQIVFDPAGDRFQNASIHSVSRDGTLLACAVRRSGSDAKEIWFFDVERSLSLNDKLPIGRNCGIAFRTENDGFFYSHETGGHERAHQIRFHRFGEPESSDICLFSAPRTIGSRLLLTGDREKLGVVYWHDTPSGLSFDLYIALNSLEPEWRRVLRDIPAPDFPILRSGRLFLYSGRLNPCGALYELEWYGSIRRLLIPGSEEKISQIAITRDCAYTAYLSNNDSYVREWPLEESRVDGIGQVLDLPRRGTIQFPAPNSASDQETLLYSFESFFEKRRCFEFSCGTSRPLFSSAELPNGCHAYTSTECFVMRDGVRLPCTVLEPPTDTELKQVPTILTGYGGFGSVSSPTFSALASILLSLGARYVIAHVRGGGEFGSEWHHAARGHNRSIGTHDLIAVAETLLEHRSDKIGLVGGSHGGLLVALAVISAPHLFSAVVCIAPLLDMVRYESFDRARHWVSEYGTVEEASDFEALLANSPYHQLADEVAYPPFLFITGDGDDRCNPAHVRKMAARLQTGRANSGRVIVDYSNERGHQPVLPLSVRIEALARRILFLCRELQIAIPRSSQW